MEERKPKVPLDITSDYETNDQVKNIPDNLYMTYAH